MPQVFPSNSSLQKAPPSHLSPSFPEMRVAAMHHLLQTWNTFLFSGLFFPFPPVPFSKLPGLHQMTFRPLSSVTEKHTAKPVPTAPWNSCRKQQFRNSTTSEVAGYESDFYSLISFFLHLVLLLGWEKPAREKALWRADGSESLRWSKCTFSTQQPSHTRLTLSICKHICGVWGECVFARLSRQTEP